MQHSSIVGPDYFALRPLSTELVSHGGVAIQTLNDDGTLGTLAAHGFGSIDVELWARQFLADVDVFVSKHHSLAAISGISIELARKKLARAILQGLESVLESPTTNAASPAWPLVRRVVYRRLLAGLTEGYDVAAVLCDKNRVQCLCHSAESDAGRTVSLGEMNAALPVRQYPSSPVLSGHTAQATHFQPKRWDDVKQWDYSVSYRHDGQPADRLEVGISFNFVRNEFSRRAIRNDDADLFAALAQYVSIASPLWSILNDMSLASAVNAMRVENAMRTFVELTERIADRWCEHWIKQRDGALEQPIWPAQCVRFTQWLEAEYDSSRGKAYYLYLYLQRTHSDHPHEWPLMSVTRHDGSTISMERGSDSIRGRRYTLPPDVEAFAPLEFEMRFDALDLAIVQSATAGCRVTRNVDLCEGIATRPAFVFATPVYEFVGAVAPMLLWREPIEIGTWSWQSNENPLRVIFDSLISTKSDAVLIRCNVEYETRAVLLQPPIKVTDSTFPNLLSAIKTWFDREQPSPRGGKWVVNISAYADQPAPAALLEVRFISAMEVTD